MKGIKRMKKGFFLIGVINLLIVMIGWVPFVHADTNNFSIEALDENGEINQQGFYQFTGSVGEQRAISIRVYNSSKEEITIKGEVNPATTNQNGLPSYVGAEKLDETLNHRMDELVRLKEDKLVIPAESSAIMEATVLFPTEEWQGDILGGLRFTEEKESVDEQTIVHEIAYTVGILLNRTDSKVVENHLNLHDVKAAQRDYVNYIEANIQNSESVIIRNLAIKAEVYAEKSEIATYQYETFNMRMAPNSNFDFAIPTGDQPLQSGDYRLVLFVTADEKEYKFEKNFKIEASKANQLNASAINLTKKTSYLPYIATGLLLCFIAFIVYRYREKK